MEYQPFTHSLAKQLLNKLVKFIEAANLQSFLLPCHCFSLEQAGNTLGCLNTSGLFLWTDQGPESSVMTQSCFAYRPVSSLWEKGGICNILPRTTGIQGGPPSLYLWYQSSGPRVLWLDHFVESEVFNLFNTCCLLLHDIFFRLLATASTFLNETFIMVSILCL